MPALPGGFTAVLPAGGFVVTLAGAETMGLFDFDAANVGDAGAENPRAMTNADRTTILFIAMLL
jgi:hypothetical protein